MLLGDGSNVCSVSGLGSLNIHHDVHELIDECPLVDSFACEHDFVFYCFFKLLVDFLSVLLRLIVSCTSRSWLISVVSEEEVRPVIDLFLFIGANFIV